MIKRILLLLSGVLAVIVAAELVLRVLPVSTATRTDYHLTPNLLTYPPHHEWTMATGWDLRNVQHMRSNNMGFAAEHDFVSGSDAVGLIGDSYVEASMLPPADRPAAQLGRALGGRLVYAMGGPGSSLLDYAERIEWAYQTLGLRTFVVLMEHVDASQALCGSGNVHARCLLPDTLEPALRRRPPSSPLKDVLRESALAQYVNSQLKFSASRLTSTDFWGTGAPSEAAKPNMDPAATAASTAPAPLEPEQKKVVDAAVNEFFRQFETMKDIRVVFVIDMKRRNLETGGNKPDEGYHLAQRLLERGQLVVRGEPLYREHQRRSTLRLDMGPHDTHLNGIGVKLLMDAAAEVLKQNSNNAKEN
ncbi:MAG: hypothetical protein IV113_14190 [Hydrogenophaga sp.]|nr:hypothetical protein [Hydrogenophaga sp.]